MKQEKVFLKKDSFIFNNKEYLLSDIKDEFMMFKNLMIVILEEKMFIKKISIKERKKDFSSFLEQKIKELFFNSEDNLFDYKKAGREAYIYSLNCREKIEMFLDGCSTLKVVPFYYMMRDKVLKKLHRRRADFSAAAEFMNNYYFIRCEKGEICDAYETEFKEDLENYIMENASGKIFLDESYKKDEYLKEKLEIIKIGLTELN